MKCTSAVRDFFRSQARHLTDGHIDQMIRPYDTPLPVYLPMRRDWVMLPGRDNLQRAFEAKYAALQEAGISALNAVPMEMRDGRPGQCRARICWFYHDADGRRQGQTVATYYMSCEGSLRVAMLEFESVAFPQLADWFTRHALA